ncbi:hypothetical protein IG193_00820 [Infirmifilum lucidum]|uniref:Uncharacterized protein n=1 Tax=Infirmifilum lucidum TaxID=2776706 RepID=A0A7L9FHB7_9CREN|nr:hypothetical protein [Infirmifilum lucidum]QOJ79041.1 hypothetical protein IG193_00820 [Infirmifilum lucidum]
MNWYYYPRPASYYTSLIEYFKSRGYTQIVAPGLWNWNRYYPNFERVLENVSNFLEAVKKAGVHGFMVTAWGDNGEECFFRLLYPLLVASMEYAEGDGKWEFSWMALTGESERVLNCRKKLGVGVIADNLKGFLLGFTERHLIGDEWIALDSFYASASEELKQSFRKA